MGYFSITKSVAWSQSNRAYFSVTEDKTENRETHKHAAAADGCSKGWVENFKKGNAAFGDIHGCQTSGRKDFHPTIKNNPYS